jgi:uncharacterized membrane protein
VRRPTMATSSRVRVRERLVPRRLFAVVAVVFPVVVEIAVTGVWWDRLPDRIATTFGPDGSPTGYGTPAGTVILFAALQALFLAAAIGSAVARDRRKGRIGCAVTAGFVAALGASWLSSAAWWFLVAAPAWACVPYWLLSPRGVKGTDH